MVVLQDSAHAASHFIDMVRAGKTALGANVMIRPRGWHSSGGYNARLFEVWINTPFGFPVQENYFMFFKRHYYNSFPGRHNFPNEVSGMSVSLEPLKKAAEAKAYVVIVMEDGSIHDIKATEWVEFVYAYEHRGVVRKMLAGNNGEHLEASIGMSKLRKLYPL